MHLDNLDEKIKQGVYQQRILAYKLININVNLTEG